jgi:hypothetical protein
MKKSLLSFLLSTLVCAGCAVHYDITQTNGMVITAIGKPHLDKEKERYLFKNAKHEQDSIPRIKVIRIAPHSMSSQKDQFISQ